MRYNADGAFIAELYGSVMYDPLPGETDTRSLPYTTFMAAPLTDFPPNSYELGFTNKDGMGVRDDETTRLMEAFAHATVIDSGETILVADIQGNSFKFLTQSLH